MSNQITRDSLRTMGITDVDQQNAVLDAQGSKNEAMAILYEDLKDCIPQLRAAEKMIHEGWIGFDLAYRQFLELSFFGGAAPYKDPTNEFTMRMSQHPNKIWNTVKDSNDDAQAMGLIWMARNMHSIAANFGLPLSSETESHGDAGLNKAYTLKYGTLLGYPGLTVANSSSLSTFRDGMIGGGTSAHLVGTAMATRMQFHHYVFTDNGSGGNNIDFAKTMGEKYKVGGFYLKSDMNEQLFVNPGTGSAGASYINRFIHKATGKFLYIHAYAQQHANREGVPYTVPALQDQTSTWYQAVKWSFASNDYSFADANIDDNEWNMGEVDARVIEEALIDATNTDDEQNDYLEDLSAAQLLSLGFTGDVDGYEYEDGVGDLNADDARAGRGGWIKAPHSIQHHGTFEQIWKLFRDTINSTQLNAARLPAYRQAMGHMEAPAILLINGIVKFASAWSCIRDAVMKYLPILKAARENIEDAFKEASGKWAKALGLLPGVDSITNTGLMNDLTSALARQSASESIGSAVQRNIFKEQCFLLSYIEQLAGIKKDRDYRGGIAPDPSTGTGGGEPKKALPYVNNCPNATLLMDGDPYGFLNKLTQSEGGRIFFNTDTEVLDHLQPMIRLFKVSYDDDGAASEDEFIFESSASGLVTMLQDRKRRGAGVGVKSFDFAYEGSNPFAVKKSISATLKIFASSMDELLLPRRNQKGNLISFADLALKTRNPPPSRGPSAPGALPIFCQPGTQGSVLAGGQGGLLAQQNQNLDKLTFRLKAVVGWATPNGKGPWSKMSNLAQVAENDKELLYKGIWNSTITLNLTPTVHHFEFDEMGRTTMVIKYLAYVEDFYDQPAFNIFASRGDDNPTAKQLVRNLQLKYFSKVCDPEKIGEVKKNLAEKANEEKPQILQSLVTSLADQNKIYHLDLSMESIGFFNSEGPYYDYSTQGTPLQPLQGANQIDKIQAQMREAIDQYTGFSGADEAEETHLFKAGLKATDPKNENLAFVYVSDLVDCIMSNIEGELKELPDDMEDELALAEIGEEARDQCSIALEKQKMIRLQKAYTKLRIVLGPLEVVNQAQGAASTLHCTFGDIPISMKYLLEWITDKLSNTAETIYTLTRFLNDLFNKLIGDFLNDGSCFNWDIKPGGKIRMNQTVITSYPMPGPNDEVTTHLEEEDVPRALLSEMPRPVFNISGVPDTPIAAGNVSQEMNYFIYFAGRVAPLDKMNGDKQTDERAGIFHYLAGRNRGLIKNIQFNKTDSTGLAEVRFEQDGYEGLQQLRVLYDVDIEMYANVKTFPGTYIFVDPRGLAPSSNLTPGDPLNLTQYGIGGYMMIVKSEHSFAPGQATSRLHAKWVNSIEGEAESRAASAANSNGASPGGVQGRCEGNITARQNSANNTP